MATEISGAIEKGDDFFLLEFFFKGFEFFRSGACVKIFWFHRHLVIDDKDQNGDFPLYCPVVFHLGDGDVVAFRNITVPMGKYSEVDVGLVDHAQGGFDGIGMEGGQMFHHVGNKIRTETGIHDHGAVVRQIPRRTADHDGWFFIHFLMVLCF